jgi:hypothetical protein
VAAGLLANFTRGPFVQNATTGSIQIVWRTGLPGSTFVEYGPTTALGSLVTNAEPVTNHVVTLTELSPDTLYYYRVGSDTGTEVLLGDIEWFRTLKASGPVSFLVYGDSGQATTAQGQIAEVLRETGGDLVLHAGDIVYATFNDGTVDTRMFNYYQPHMKNTPYFLAIGNHDLGCCSGEVSDYNPTNWPANATNFQNAFYLPTNSMTGTEHFYSFDHGDVHFVALYNPWFANYRFTNGTDQFTWLTNDLAASTKPWKVLYFHMPLANSGAHAGRDDNLNGIADGTEVLDLLLPAAEQWGVDLAIAGHEHNFERFAPTNGMHHFVTGGGGAAVYSFTRRHVASAQFRPVNHCSRVTVRGETAVIEALDASGAVFDSIVIHRVLAEDRVHESTWNTPLVEPTPGSDDGNVAGQAFDFAGEPIPARAGKFSNLGWVWVNNDSTNLYLGFKSVMLYPNANFFVFVASPRQPGVATMAGLGNGVIDPAGEGVDGLDCLENLAFSNFAPSIACVLGDEFGDGTSRDFARRGLDLNLGQGVFQLNAGFDAVPEALVQQYNRSPQGAPVAADLTEQSADVIEVSIPFSALGGVLPGDVIRIGAVAAGAGFDANAQTRQLDTAALGTRLDASGQGAALLTGVRVRLASLPNLDNDGDGLFNVWEIAHDLNPNSAAGDHGADGDPDGDGFSNAAEQLAGTHPRDPESVLRVRLTRVAPRRFRVDWQAVLGRKYQLEYANGQVTNYTDFSGSNWPRVALSEQESYEDDLTADPAPPWLRAYRVRLVP